MDLVEIARIEAAIGRSGQRFLDRIFTVDEQACCERRGSGRFASYAARFAAKEAAAKALRTGIGSELTWLGVEVITRANGGPELRFHLEGAKTAARLGVRSSHVTLTHSGGMAAATVLLTQ
jgi:holo-[acyl-carrier protein] synthase